MSFKQSDENFGTRPFKRTTWKDLPPKQNESPQKQYVSDPEETAKQIREAFAVAPRKPDFIDHVQDEIDRQSLMTPEQIAREQRLVQLDAAGYSEVRLPDGHTTVVKKEDAEKMVKDYTVSMEDISALRPVDPRMVGGPEVGDWTDEDYGYDDPENEPELEW